MGHTAKNVEKAVYQALGGVLFIDEIGGAVDSKFGRDLVTSLNELMEDNNDDLVIAIAGYPDDVKNFLDMDPGLKRRFARRVEFKAFNNDELMQIVDLNVQQHGLYIDNDAKTELQRHFIAVRNSDGRNFGNAGAVENVIEAVIDTHAQTMNPDMVNKFNELDDEREKKRLLTLNLMDVRKTDIASVINSPIAK